ncbi:MAG: plasmid pRiA4b ORF-3 family protein [Betaproteobacteria bacterium]|nr:plasmid pRiA4b ORF-3 family protein [Betaproteobacteria bacterium]
MPTPQIIHQFKITLLDSDPEIWRRIQVPATYTFWDLHVAIQSAMGWEDYHLHMFRIGKRSEIIINGNPTDDDLDDDENTFNGWEIEASSFLETPGDVALYEYDLGDGWLHEILLEGVFLKEKGIRYPNCIAGARACPPEDCGGIPGFEHMLEVLASPRHPEHKDLIKWLGKEFEADKFDPQAVRFANPKNRWKHWQE